MALFLIGFMAAGKTSVGRAIAAATGRAFVDLDDAIAEMGEPAATLVARDEPEFRRREAAALARCGSGDTVIATGGGAAAYGDNLERMRAAGLVVALGVDVAEAEKRVAAGANQAARPLMANAQALAAQRAPIYRRAHAVVDTMGQSIAEVAAAVLAVERAWQRLPWSYRDATILALGERSYPITVSAALDAELVRSQLGNPSRIAIVTDANVARHAPALSPLRALGLSVVEIAPGEASKSIHVFDRLCNELVGHGLDRGSAIVALGGGVVGDLAGFVAASLFRGIAVVQVPTTIVAMTDAAIGGKTAIDLPAGKNLVGAFWQPRLVACATDTLATLPGRERRAGFGELWKYALLDGRDLWARVAACAGWAADTVDASAGGDGPLPTPELRPVIDRAIAYKAATVGRDERELTGHRALLNLGHTIGHAIESATGMLHGEAVGLGLVAACRVSVAVVGARADLEANVTSALAASGLPTDLDRYLDDPVLDRISVDKKRVGGSLRFIVIREVGACEPIDIPVTEVRRILRPGRRT